MRKYFYTPDVLLRETFKQLVSLCFYPAVVKHHGLFVMSIPVVPPTCTTVKTCIPDSMCFSPLSSPPPPPVSPSEPALVVPL